MKRLPIYQPLREHPQWASLLALSDEHAATQRAIYLQLIAEDAELAK